MVNITFQAHAKTSIQLEELDSIVQEALTSFNVPGVAIGVIFEDQTLFSKGYGMRDLERKLPVTEETLFPIVSCTKPFTALLIAALVDQGKLDWDDPVQKYVPEFNLLNKEIASEITIRDLIAHRTGVKRHDALWIYKDLLRTDTLKLFPHVDSVSGLRKEFEYNNFMYSLAATILERVTGQSWEEALASRLLKPLSMTASNTSIVDLELSENYSLPYAELFGNMTNIPFRNLSPVNPGGGINSSVKEMLKWVQLHLSNGEIEGKSLISKEALNETYTPQMPLIAPMQFHEEISLDSYGLGWFLGSYRGFSWIQHDGCIDGFFSDVSFLPEKKIGVIILTNSSSDGPFVINAVRNHIYEQLLKVQSTNHINHLKTLRDQRNGAIDKSHEEWKALQENPPKTRTFSDYTGEFFHPAYGTIKVFLTENSLNISFGSMTTPIYEKKDNVFLGQSTVLLHYGIMPYTDFTFITDESGKPSSISILFEGFRKADPIVFLKSK